ncbi:MAG: 50S ribosomal protein L24 [Desulfovibrionales bacterium]|nr:MAG: 50S ribosomal protein L24 [Desulfovibrionales bacterium]
MKNRKIHKNDKVMIMVGKEKGKIGKVLKLFPKTERVLVEGVNKVKRHSKGNPYKGETGGIKEKENPMHLSNVTLVCDACAQPTRVGYKLIDSDKKVRFCKKCNEIIA